MTRRTFLRLALFALLAGGVRVSKAQDAPTMSSKGIVCTNPTPTLLNPLNLGWYRTSFGSWCWNWQANMPQGWVFNLHYTVPNSSDVTLALANPYHGNWWMIGGNEAATETNLATGLTWTPQEIANLVMAQIDAVIAAQPTAKFCLAGGIQTHAPGNRWGNPVWIDGVLALLPQSYKDKIKAIDFHWYSQVEYSANDTRIFNKAPIKRGINDWKDWRTAKTWDVQLWLSEIGLTYSALVTATNQQVIDYPLVVNLAAEETALDRWCVYVLEGQPSYVCIYENGLSGYGQTFAVVQ